MIDAKITQIFMVAVSSLVFVLPSKSAGDNKEDDLGREIAQIHEQMGELIENGVCEVDAQCRLLPIGHKPCGGPSGYLAYSTQLDAAQIDRLGDLSERSQSLSRKRNELSQMLSNCQYEPEPSVSCIESKCKIQQTESGSSPVF